MNPFRSGIYFFIGIALAFSAVYYFSFGRYVSPKKLIPAAVKITNTEGNRGGSGFHVKAPSGKIYILTNRHICRLADGNDVLKVERSTESGEHFEVPAKEYYRKVVKRYPFHDLCLVESIQEESYIDVSEDLFTQTTLSLIGHPGLRPVSITQGEYIGTTKIRLTTKIVDDPSKCKRTSDKIMLLNYIIGYRCFKTYIANRINMIGYPGNSGSMVVNSYGELVGVLFAGNRRAITDLYMVPLEDIKDFLKDY